MHSYCTCKMKPRKTETNTRTGKVRKTFDFDPAAYRKAEAILKIKQPRCSLTALVESLWIAEYERLCAPKSTHRAY
jgi:hypothetical protein